ncbi:Avirulence (Avh) protein [Phytophthora megakarya]|uniref:Avirulence (Avh) protein n=1 Tax=Phytophthora megakarya TaxID=4795 RepID=A0A225UKQ6_9STRA|nr:Avirulence (Avh) protein [Phytophthora megakarya]
MSIVSALGSGVHPFPTSSNDVNEERGISIPSISNIQGLFGKSSGLSKKLVNLRTGDNVVSAVEKNTAVKKLAVALDKNPASLKKVLKDPQVTKVAASMGKKSKMFSNVEVSSLRQLFAKDPIKANKFDVAIKIIGDTMIGTMTVGLASLVILAMVAVYSAIA